MLSAEQLGYSCLVLSVVSVHDPFVCSKHQLIYSDCVRSRKHLKVPLLPLFQVLRWVLEGRAIPVKKTSFRTDGLNHHMPTTNKFS